MCRSGKRVYESSLDAMLALQRIHQQRNIDALEKYERSYYQCACGKHHLTSWRTSTG